MKHRISSKVSKVVEYNPLAIHRYYSTPISNKLRRSKVPPLTRGSSVRPNN